MSYDDQKQIFERVTGWLKDYGFKIENLKAKQDDLNFYCEVRAYEKRPDFFKIMMSEKTKDSLLMQAYIMFEEPMIKSLDMTRRKEQQQLFIDFRKSIFPLKINFESNREIRGIILHRTIFFDSLGTKQFFYDCVLDMFNAMLLVTMVMDDFINSIFPEGT